MEEALHKSHTEGGMVFKPRMKQSYNDGNGFVVYGGQKAVPRAMTENGKERALF